jgi:hypothetical protein
VTTQVCFVTISDSHGEQIKRVKPDDQGWIYTSVPTSAGMIFLGQVACSLSAGADTQDMATAMAFGAVGVLATSGGIPTFESRQLHYALPGGRKVLYFGHVTLRIGKVPDTQVAPFVRVRAPGRKTAKAATIAHFDQLFDLEDGYSLALEDLKARFGTQVGSVEPVDGAAGVIAGKR